MSKVQVMDHPLIQHKINYIRNEEVGSKEFREIVGEIASLMCYEATRDLPLKEVDIATPVAVAKTKIISGRKLAFVPILRAGLGMLDGVTNLVPAAKIAVFSEWRCADASFCRIAGMNGPNILIARDGRIRRIISGERVYGALSGSALFAFSE